MTLSRVREISRHPPRQAPSAPIPTSAGAGYLPLALITLLGGVLRFYRLDHQSLWMDEVLTVLSSHTSLASVLFDPPVDPNIPPLYYLLMSALQGLGDSEIALRMPSAVVGVLSIPLMYSVARQWLGRTALLAALLLAVSPLHVWYSQEARPYALLIFLALLGVRFLQQGLASRAALAPRIGFAVTMAAAFYVHTVAFAFVAAMALYVLLVAPRTEWRAWLGTFAALALLSLPGVYLLLRIPPTVSANPFYVFNPSHLAYTLWAFATGYSLGPNLIELRTEGAAIVLRSLLLILPIMSVFVTLLGLGAIRLRHRQRHGLTFLVLGVVVPISFVVLGSWVTSHPYNVRYTLLALPPTLMLLASGTQLFRARWGRITAMGFILTVSAASLWNYYFDPRYFRDDNRGAAAFIRRNAALSELVIVSAAYTTVPLRHYLGSTSPRLVGYPSDDVSSPAREGGLGAKFVQPGRLEQDFRVLLGDRRSFWLCLSRTFHSDPEGHLRRHADENYRRVAEFVGPGVDVVHYVRSDAPDPTSP
jgi:4-amino-4-deoxy-L-arabinose transferase-like glycosyltransferase